MGLNMYALDVHKRHVKQLLEKVPFLVDVFNSSLGSNRYDMFGVLLLAILLLIA